MFGASGWTCVAWNIAASTRYSPRTNGRRAASVSLPGRPPSIYCSARAAPCHPAVATLADDQPDVWFRYGPHGKPVLWQTRAGQRFGFNVSTLLVWRSTRSPAIARSGLTLSACCLTGWMKRLAELCSDHSRSRVSVGSHRLSARGSSSVAATRNEACLKAQEGALSMLAGARRTTGRRKDLARGGRAQGRDLDPPRWLLGSSDLRPGVCGDACRRGPALSHQRVPVGRHRRDLLVACAGRRCECPMCGGQWPC